MAKNKDPRTQNTGRDPRVIIQGLNSENALLKNELQEAARQVQSLATESEFYMNRSRTLEARNRLFDTGAAIYAGLSSNIETEVTSNELAVESMNGAEAFCAEYDARLNAAVDRMKAEKEEARSADAKIALANAEAAGIAVKVDIDGDMK